MALNVESAEHNLGIKVEGDLGDLQIIEEGSDSDENSTGDSHEDQDDTSGAGALSAIPTGLQSTGAPVFGSVAVTHSENVQFGNNTYFHGPVTIKQIIQTNSGIDNTAYNKTEDENKPEKKIHCKEEPSVQKFKIQTWHKLVLSAVGVVIVSGICAVVIITHGSKIQDLPNTNNDDISNGDSSSNEVIWTPDLKFLTQFITTGPALPSSNGFPPPSPGPVVMAILGGSLCSDDDDSVSFLRTPVACRTGICHAKVVVLNEVHQVIIISIILASLTSLLVTYCSLLTKETLHGNETNVAVASDTYCSSQTNKAKEDDATILIAPGHLRIVSRTDWLAQPVEKPLDVIRHPIPWVIITHTATAGCFNQSACVLSVRLIQTFHIESRGWYDIGYNFLVGGDGSAYYGRGWDYVGAHTKGYNKYSVGIAFIGTFNTDNPPRRQIEACQKLIRQGVEAGKLAKDYKLFAHRQLMSSLSPGDKVYDIIKEWPHFVKNDTDITELIPNY